MSFKRKPLPIDDFKAELIAAVKEHQVIVCVGETGSGKTTQLPQFLLDGGVVSSKACIGVTQPRRVAAVSVARRVAEERVREHSQALPIGLLSVNNVRNCYSVDCCFLYCQSVKVGGEVGHKIRFDDSTTASTRIKFMTDGILVRPTGRTLARVQRPELSNTHRFESASLTHCYPPMMWSFLMKPMSAAFTPTSCLASLRKSLQSAAACGSL